MTLKDFQASPDISVSVDEKAEKADDLKNSVHISHDLSPSFPPIFRVLRDLIIHRIGRSVGTSTGL